MLADPEGWFRGGHQTGSGCAMLVSVFRHVLFALLSLLPLACSSEPRAPALRNDPVFEDSREGIRFLAPDSWVQKVRGSVPPGAATQERALVEYQRAGGTQGASFRLSLIDLPESENLSAYLARPSFSVENWKPLVKPEEVPIGSAKGQRFLFGGRLGRTEMVKEVVAVRRGNRTYFFTSLYEPRDPQARDEIRGILQSVVWK